MLILTTKHYRSGTVRRTVNIYEDINSAELEAIASMQAERSIEEIDILPITSLKTGSDGITLVRPETERSMRNATESN
jgi:hypothetical protein